jgi:hypothetical protein
MHAPYTNGKFLDMIHHHLTSIFVPHPRVTHGLKSGNFGTPRVLFIALDIVGAPSLNFPREFGSNIYRIHYQERA